MDIFQFLFRGSQKVLSATKGVVIATEKKVGLQKLLVIKITWSVLNGEGLYHDTFSLHRKMFSEIYHYGRV